MKEKRLEIKPEFFLLPNAISPSSLFVLIFTSIFISLIFSSINIRLPFFFILLFSLFLVYLYLLYINLVYQSTNFALSRDKIIYSRNYLFFKESRIIKTSEIREISEFQNILQEKCSIGSIILHSRITNQGNLIIKDIPNHSECASKIREICEL